MLATLAFAATFLLGTGSLFGGADLDHSEHHHIGCAFAMLPDLDQDAVTLPMDAWPKNRKVEPNPKETRLRNVTQLTFGGQNAEAYWSVDGKKIVYQSLQPGYPDEQIFRMNADGSDRKLISTGKGRCTCSYFSPDGKWIYFSSTHERNEGPQKKLDMSKGYLWMVNPDFALYRRPADGKGRVERILMKDGYIAETTIAPNGRFMTFTGNFEGDLEIYRSNLDGTGLVRLTNEVGYDGGPFVSWDSKKIVYRRAPALDAAGIEEYRQLLSEHLVRPGKLEIWIMDADGRNKRQVTHLGAASFAPFLHPNGRQIIFSSNYGDPRGREFDLWVVNVDGTGLEQVTKTPDFDGFPMFSRDGKKLLFASNRFGVVRGETNVFVADWNP
jgi:Tol biopolymer transport system component